MFSTVQGLCGKIDHEIEYININLDMYEGKLDNPNGYTNEFLLGFVARQFESLSKTIESLATRSTNDRLIKKYRNKYKSVATRFSEILWGKA